MAKYEQALANPVTISEILPDHTGNNAEKQVPVVNYGILLSM